MAPAGNGTKRAAPGPKAAAAAGGGGGGGGAKETQKRQRKVKEAVFREQAKAMSRMAAAIMMKAKILEDQNLLKLFTVPDEQLTTEDAREYFKLRRMEELSKLRQRFGGKDLDSVNANGVDYQLSSAEAAEEYFRLRRAEEVALKREEEVSNLKQRLGRNDEPGLGLDDGFDVENELSSSGLSGD